MSTLSGSFGFAVRFLAADKELLAPYSITCRKRHLKCDEEKPACRQCTRNNKSCSYPTGAIAAVQGSVPDSQTSSTPHRGSPVETPSDDVDNRNGDVEESRFIFQPHQPQSPQYGGADDIAVAEQEDRHRGHRQGELPSSRTPFGTSELQSSPIDTRRDSYTRRNAEFHPTTISSGPELGISMSGYNQTSPLSTGAASWDQPIGVATARWFGMLAGDADIQLEPTIISETNNALDLDNDISATGQHQFRSYVSEPRPIVNEIIPGVTQIPTVAISSKQQQQGRLQVDVSQWHSLQPLTLKSHEQALFDNFVTHISEWMDLFNAHRHFSSLVPRLALHNVGLLNAVLALSTRHRALCSSVNDATWDPFSAPEDALRYYNETLQYVRKALQHESYHTSDELLATTLIISAFEMLGDGSSRDWERHLQGVFWIQNSQVIHGDSGGLRASIWWAWICQDIWAAFRDKRKVFSFWRPQRTFRDMNPTELAARSVFVLARVMNFCAREESEHLPDNILSRLHTAEVLSSMLDEWASLLTPEFSPLPCSGGEQAPLSVFQPLWIHPPAFGVSVQVHHAARILLLLNRPSLGGINEAMQRQVALDKHVAVICGIALKLSDYASSTMSSQCLFIGKRIDHALRV